MTVKSFISLGPGKEPDTFLTRSACWRSHQCKDDPQTWRRL